MTSDDAGSFYVFKQRVLFSLFRAAARVGVRLKMPLGQMEELFRLAYFREARVEQDMLLDDVASLFGKSLRTVAAVHKKFQGEFFEPEDQLAFRRDIVRQLDKGPCTRDELAAVWPDRGDLGVAIDDLVRGGVLVEAAGRLLRNPLAVEFLDDSSARRQVDGLNRQMDVLAETVWRRMVERAEDGPEAIARTYAFTASEADFAVMLRELQTLLRDRAIAADAAAQDANIYTQRAVTFSAATLDEETE